MSDSEADVERITPRYPAELVFPLVDMRRDHPCPKCGVHFVFEIVVSDGLYECRCGQKFYLRAYD